MAAWAFTQPALAGTLAGAVTHVRDGDTLEVSGVAIRLMGLNCEELGTDRGQGAASALRRLVAGERLVCDLTGVRTHDRMEGRCALEDGRDLGAEMIRSGDCGRCARFDADGKYVTVQDQAGPWEGDVPGYCRSRR